MKSVLISIQPKWCELIASGKKTVEVRKTKPKLETPFKVYIYETLGKTKWCNTCKDVCERLYPNCACHEGWGKVIGEFVCDEIFPIRVFENGTIQDYNCHAMERSCIPYDDIVNYIGNGCMGYGWHISDLVIYDEPKELGEFYTQCKECPKTGTIDIPKKCRKCKYQYTWNLASKCRIDGTTPIKRPPQSWCYVGN